MYKLLISTAVTFVARMSVLDGEKEREFGLRLQAQRLPQGVSFQDALKAKPVYTDFLADRQVKLLGWDGEPPPLVDDAGNQAPPDDAALQALLAQPGAAQALVGCYAEAVGLKAKLGN